MKFLPFIFILLISACSSSTLDKTFDDRLYNGYYKKMLQEKEISIDDLFLLNYSIVRQRDYYDYTIEGKTYREILAQAKAFSEKGLPVEFKYDTPDAVENLVITISNQGDGTMRPNAKSSRLVKVFNFSATYKNTSDKDIALRNSSFVIKGPFQEHITTIGYEVNCLLESQAQVEIGFLVEARAIYNNVVYDTNYDVERLDMNNLLYGLSIESGGMSIETQTANFDACVRTNARRTPFKVIDYESDMSTTNWITSDEKGEKVILEIGNTFLEPKEEAIRTINLGN